MHTSSSPLHAQPARIAEELGFSASAAEAMRAALIAGNGSMAQFDHPEFGGSGQWMRGGMVMTGALHDHALKERIDRLCNALAESVARDPELVQPGSFQSQSRSGAGVVAGVQDSRDFEAGPGAHVTPRGTAWWPRSLGVPDSAGMQDDVRYAWFSRPRRLAIETEGHLVVYDTGDHRIGGFSQQQGARSRVSFASQHGPIDLADLPVVPAADADDARELARPVATEPPRTSTEPHADPFEALEKLAQLHARGIVSDAEFQAKKAELLARI